MTGKRIEKKDFSYISKRHKGEKVVFVTGCFDLFHQGHIFFLKAAKEYGDILVVGVNSDISIKRLKGEKRPIILEEGRMNILENIDLVDYIVLLDNDYANEYLKLLKPDVFAIGENTRVNFGQEVIYAKKHGIKVQEIPRNDDISSTNIIKKIEIEYTSR